MAIILKRDVKDNSYKSQKIYNKQSKIYTSTIEHTINKGAYITYTEPNHHIFSFINTTTNTDRIESTILYKTIDK